MAGLLMGGVRHKVASGGSDLLTEQYLITEMSSQNTVMVLGFSFQSMEESKFLGIQVLGSAVERARIVILALWLGL